MSNFSGILQSGNVTGNPPTFFSPDFTRFPGSLRDPYTRPFSDSCRWGARYGDGLVSPEPMQEFGGNVCEVGGQELWEKIIILPRSRDCGFVTSEIHWDTNVWNTHRRSISVLARIDVQDSGNVSVNSPLGFPIRFAPLQARVFDTVVPAEGDPTINARLIFVFAGESADVLASGTVVTVMGMRITVFAAEPDWSEPVKERIQYLTDIIAAYTAREQRVGLRKNPRTRLSFRVMPTDALTAAAVEALLYGRQGRVLGVPFWPDAVALEQASPMGTTTIRCDTTGRRFTSGGMVLLWRDVFTNEAAAITGVNASTITSSAPLNMDWPADGRTYAVPLLPGWWDGDATMAHLSPDTWELDAAFQCDLAAGVTPASPAQFYGYDVLGIQPNSIEDRSTVYSRAFRVIDCDTGRFTRVDRAGRALGRFEGFLWTMTNRNEITDARAWLALRMGRLKACWVPSWRHDLVQASAIGARASSISIRACGYTRHQFPRAARRYIRILLLDGSGASWYRRVTAAVETGPTETLTLDAQLGNSGVIPVGGCMISFLRLSRLAADDIELVWHSRDVAEINLQFVELPHEVP